MALIIVTLTLIITRNNKSGICSEGFEHIENVHFNPAKKGKSQFTIDKEELKYLLQSQRVVSKIPTELPGGGKKRYLRVVKLSKVIGIDAKAGGKQTKHLSIITDKFGNILTSFPGN